MANNIVNLSTYKAIFLAKQPTLTIGGTGKTFNGTVNVSWSMNDIMGSSDSTKFYRGDKTWSDTLTGGLNLQGNLTISNNGPHIYLQNTSWTKGTTPTTNYYSALEFITNGTYNNNLRVGIIESNIDTSNNTWLNIWVIPNASGSTSWSGIRLKKTSADVLTIYNQGNTEINGALTVSSNITTSGDGIYYTGTKATIRMIRWIDNTNDVNGNGISIGGGGLTVLGSGESANTILTNLSLTASGGTETTYICSDNNIEFYPGQNSYDASAKTTINNSGVWVGTDGNTTREMDVGVASGAGRIYMYSVASTTGNRGIYVPAHGTGGAKSVFIVDTNNDVTFYGTATALSNFQVSTTTNLGLDIATNTIGYVSGLTKDTWNYQQTDGAIYGQFFNANWKAEIYQDYRTGRLSVRGKNSGTWQSWYRILDEVQGVLVFNTSNIGSSSSVTFNDLAAAGNAVGMINSATDNPCGSNTWVHGISLCWNKGVNTSWISQIAFGASSGGMWYRSNGSGTIVGKAWTRVIDDVNWYKRIFANKNISRTTLTVSSSTWNVTSGTDVFGLSFKDSALKYTPAGGSATASTDSGDWRAWLTCAAASNTVELNMRIDGSFQAGKFIGPLTGNVTGNCSGSSGSCTGNAATANTWKTARTLTIGNKDQSVSGSGNVSWTLHDILYSSTTIGAATSWDQTTPGVYYVASGSAFTGTNNPEDANTNNGIAPYRYGQLIVSRANSGGLAQFYISHNDSNSASYGIHFRTGWNSSYVAKWSVLLDSHNYTNWTVTKTGSGASGSWGISVTGSAATLAPTSAAAYTTDTNGNFKHKRTTNTDNWQIQNSSGTAKFQFYWETGNLTCTSVTASLTGNVTGNCSGSSGSCTGNAATATRINGNLSAASSNVNRNIWVSSTANADGIPNYCSNFYYNPSSATLGIASGGRLYANGGNLYLGNSNNSGWVLTQDICSHTGTGDTYWSARADGTGHFKKVYGAVWNDYAEMRNVPQAQLSINRICDEKGEVKRDYPCAGRCVSEIGNGEMKLTNKRMQKGCKIISDTFGFCIGENEECKTPIAVTGRVLAYPLESLEDCSQHIGDFLCSGPNGTVSIMTTEEAINYPESIVGTISEIPNYDIWYCGNKDTKPIKVNGRIWIYVR